MKRFIDLSYRRVLVALAVVGIVGSATQQSARAQTSTTLPGVVAAQPTAPGKIVSCDVVVVDGSFTPQIAFDSSAIVKSSTVTFSFFDKSNASLGKIDLTPPYEKQTLPPGTDTFTCAIAHEVMADGTVFPAAANNNTALVVGGIAGVGLIAALVGHGGSSGSAPAPNTPAPTTPTSTPTPTSSPTVSPSPTATATVKPSPTATATASASPTVSPTPTPTPTSTASTMPIATASPTASSAPSATASPTPSAAPTATASPTASASPTATPTVNPSAPVLSTNPVDINGTNNTGTSTISEQNYSGTFTASGSTCGSGGSPQPNQTPGPIAAISAGPYSSGTTITVTANEAGSCSVTFTDANMLSVTLDITITTTSIGVNGKKRVASPSRTAPVPKPLPGAAPSVPQKARGTGRLS